MTYDIPKEYLDVEAEKERIDKKLDSCKRKIRGHSTGTEFQEDHIR